jgi:hypothetical protein
MEAKQKIAKSLNTFQKMVGRNKIGLNKLFSKAFFYIIHVTHMKHHLDAYNWPFDKLFCKITKIFNQQKISCM